MPESQQLLGSAASTRSNATAGLGPHLTHFIHPQLAQPPRFMKQGAFCLFKTLVFVLSAISRSCFVMPEIYLWKLHSCVCISVILLVHCWWKAAP
nr:hypothetical protein [Tanacetum cinerariifolium]